MLEQKSHRGSQLVAPIIVANCRDLLRLLRAWLGESDVRPTKALGTRACEAFLPSKWQLYKHVIGIGVKMCQAL